MTSWDLCDLHNITYIPDEGCYRCRIAELEAKLEAVTAERDEVMEASINQALTIFRYHEKLDRVQKLPIVQVRMVHDGKHVRRSAVLMRDVQSALGDEDG